MIRRTLALACAAGLIGALIGATGAQAQTAQAQTAPAQTAPAKNDYAKAEAWLCWPGKAGDACAVDLTTTVVTASMSIPRCRTTRVWCRT